ncbi:transcription termination factor NusA [Acholeplasma hippikon]|uniref:Transcription termination/antitermination protein NusA n=1 Tax=Acholeplasma hippikon TaxID=264636 RepID=A0A449BJN0_9MOLU|nr:transcription termination factor NusA [Acholeplasma hippikon]VEU82675.1 Transcription elongation protein nusA [Acholeplasma hippikon]
MISKAFYANIEEVALDNDLTREQVFYAFEQGLIAACKKQLGVQTCRVDFREEKNEILIYGQYYVLPEGEISLDLDKKYTFITLADAKEINARAKAGEVLEVKIEPSEFNHNASRDLKNRYNEVLNSIKKETQYQALKKLQNEMVNARVLDVEQDFYRIEIAKDVVVMLPKKETLPQDNFHIGDRVKVLITDVEMKTKGPKIYVSRTNTALVTRLLEDLVPEIKDGTIEVVGIARDAGDRSKVGLRSNNPNVDVIGATVGEGGLRIKEISKFLGGEKIDLFRWSDNEKDLIANSLQPAPVVAVTKINPKEKTALAIVPDAQLSLAIGKLGQNVKLAVQASGWSIDIKSETVAHQEGIIY